MMRGRILVYDPGSTLPDMHVVGKPPTLEFLRNTVGGTFKTIYAFTTYQGRPCVAVCNTNVNRQPLRVNAEATRLWREALKVRGIPPRLKSKDLIGTVVVITGDAEFMKEAIK